MACRPTQKRNSSAGNRAPSATSSKAMPGNEVARLQVLRISWDTRNKRWFHLDPPDVKEKLDPTDELHWTGLAQRWNHMCADCHSTSLQKNYDVAKEQY